MCSQKERRGSTMAAARQIFHQEVEQRLPQAREALEAIKTGSREFKPLETLYRFAHTLKGSGQMVDIRDIAEPAAEMEVALLLVKDYGVEMGAGLQRFVTERLEEILEEVDRLRSMEVPSSGVTPPAMAGGKRILVVDDDPAITELVRERLEREGFFVAVCHDTLAAEHYLQVEHPELIVLDVVMPGGDGIEFCRKIRSDPHRQAVPIIFFSVKGELQDKLVGFATGADDYLPKPFELEELVARIHALLTRLESFKDWAWRDELTRVYNRRYLHRRLEEEVARAQRSNGRFSLAMIDIDLFKSVNDSFGHRVGDEVLRFLVARMTETLRVADVICRYGGEEFVVILPDTPLPEGHLALERLRQAVQAEPLELPGSPMRIPFTISAGVAGFPEDGCTGEELLDAADTAMYRAKEAGRNTVLLSGEVVK